jgi:cellulose synthase/poly-beta-1,6-N-acetylglucosamine synthase-like glycosyltransferase
MIVEIAFWTLTGLIIYVYAGYPLLLVVATAFSGSRQRRHDDGSAAFTPRVTLVISAYNEADCISAKLDNTLGLDYPKTLLETIVVSDASDDGTDEIVGSYAQHGVKLLRMPQRGGKTLGLNAAVAVSNGEILIFSDANALYRADAVRALVAPFADTRVGSVIGESTYDAPDSASGRSESLYWRYEVAIKVMESELGSVVGGDGAICSVRRALYEPMAADALSDFVNPLQVVRAGFRCIYEPRAVSYEPAAASFTKEYRRKVRIVNRAWRATLAMREMLNPLKHGTFALKLWSHKLLRWWVPVLLVGAFATNALLLTEGVVYVFAFVCQLGFYALAAFGYLRRNDAQQPSLLRIPFFFCLVNLAAGVGLLEAARGKAYTTWATARANG